MRYNDKEKRLPIGIEIPTYDHLKQRKQLKSPLIGIAKEMLQIGLKA